MESRLVVVLVSKNNPKEVVRTLESLSALKNGNFRILIVDSSSDHQIRALLEKNIPGPPMTYVWAPAKGIYPAMNEALRHIGDSEYVMYLNPGDILLDTKALATLVSSLATRRLEWGFGRAVAQGTRNDLGFPLIGAEIELMELLEGRLRISHQAVVASRTALVAVGGFRNSLRIAADLDLLAKLLSQHDPHFVDACLIAYDEFGVSHKRIFRTYFESTIVRWDNSEMSLFRSVRISLRNFVVQRKLLGRLNRGRR